MADQAQRTFGEIFAERRAKFTPEVNGSYRPDMLRGTIFAGKTPAGDDKIEIVWSDDSDVAMLTRGLRRAFEGAVRDAAKELGTFKEAPLAVVGHIALIPLVDRQEVEAMLQEAAHLPFYEAA
jgi:hypothetical protein